jgi:hypothetical protein
MAEARREKIPTDMIALACDDPDDARSSEHDELRESRTRWFAAQVIDIVVDIDDGCGSHGMASRAQAMFKPLLG